MIMSMGGRLPPAMRRGFSRTSSGDDHSVRSMRSRSNSHYPFYPEIRRQSVGRMCSMLCASASLKVTLSLLLSLLPKNYPMLSLQWFVLTIIMLCLNLTVCLTQRVPTRFRGQLNGESTAVSVYFEDILLSMT